MDIQGKILFKKSIYIHYGIKSKKNWLAGVANGQGMGRPQAWGEARGKKLPKGHN